MYNRVETSEYFQKGKKAFEIGQTEIAIESFNSIVATVAPFSDSDPQSYTTWNTALTNLGHAKYLKGYSEGDRELVASGLADFNRVIATAPNEEQLNRMAANGRLNEWKGKLQHWR